MASLSRHRPGHGRVDADVVNADIVHADEVTVEFVEFKPEGVDDVEDKVVKVFFSGLFVQPGE
jgi:hypothetical protein